MSAANRKLEPIRPRTPSNPPVFKRIDNVSLRQKKQKKFPLIRLLALALLVLSPFIFSDKPEEIDGVELASSSFEQEVFEQEPEEVQIVPSSHAPNQPARSVDLPPITTSGLEEEAATRVFKETEQAEKINLENTISKIEEERIEKSLEKVFDAPFDRIEEKLVSHKVKKGDTWSSISKRYGFPLQDAHAIDKAHKKLAKKEKLKRNLFIGQELEFAFGSKNKLLKRVKTTVAPGTEVLIDRVEGIFVGNVEREAHKTEDRILVGKITNSERTFAGAVRSAGVSYDVVDELVDVISDSLNFRQDLRIGDRFVILYSEKLLSSGDSLGVSNVKAALIEAGSRKHTAIRFVGSDGRARYFDDKGQHRGTMFLRYPLKFSRISSQFSKARFHPVLKRYRKHNGVDFAAPTGTTVRSVADGRVIYSGWKGGGGKTVKIQHTDRYATAYLHLSRISKGIKKGARVKRGQKIGAVGMTGLATGPHLHYSFYDKGRYVDPMKIKLPRVANLKAGQKITKAELTKTLELLEKYLGDGQDKTYVRAFLPKALNL